ncbi:hypothetical protein F2Q68_00003901 [Brassica cretica]|uniref:Glutamine amidotransferase type-2 domain-containing protein n=1 Tax=Brassica cretica TaxID=69181 RepID=A0A8S9JNW4_BRACR|nr:hypothetical protein F2Q68_00003901 [Brassica cretica]
MCGILAVLGCIDNSQAKRSRIIELSRRLRHRGPDWSGLHSHEDCYLAHERLAIIDPTSGDQPLYNQDKTVVVTVNGEIYNHKILREKLKSHQFWTGSDCEVIAHLYEEHGEEFIDMLDGMFAFVLLDTRDKSFIAARDAIGVIPLYIGWGVDAWTFKPIFNKTGLPSPNSGVFDSLITTNLSISMPLDSKTDSHETSPLPTTSDLDDFLKKEAAVFLLLSSKTTLCCFNSSTAASLP